MNAQHDIYFEQLWVLFGEARRTIVEAKEKGPLGIDAWLLAEVIDTERFDHRPLQRLHDLIAASFRRWIQSAGPLPFGKNAGEAQSFKIAAWRSYLASEARALCTDPAMAKAVVVAAARANTDEGRAAESVLSLTANERYGGKQDSWSDISEVAPSMGAR